MILYPVTVWDLPWIRHSLFFKNTLSAVTCLYTCDFFLRKIGLWKWRKSSNSKALLSPCVGAEDISYLYNLLLSLGKIKVTLLGFEQRMAKKFQYLLTRIESESTLRGCIDPNYMKHHMESVLVFLRKVSPQVVILSHKVSQKRHFFNWIMQGKVTDAIYLNISSHVYEQINFYKPSRWQRGFSILRKILGAPGKGCLFCVCLLYCVILTVCPIGTHDGASHA